MSFDEVIPINAQRVAVPQQGDLVRRALRQREQEWLAQPIDLTAAARLAPRKFRICCRVGTASPPMSSTTKPGKLRSFYSGTDKRGEVSLLGANFNRHPSLHRSLAGSLAPIPGDVSRQRLQCHAPQIAKLLHGQRARFVLACQPVGFLAAPPPPPSLSLLVHGYHYIKHTGSQRRWVCSDGYTLPPWRESFLLTRNSFSIPSAPRARIAYLHARCPVRL